MANPELQRGSTDADWVRYLQECLAARLASQAAAGDIRLSAVDGDFGPITEASVEYLQQNEGLPVTGIVDEATWQVLEGGAGAGAGAPGAGGGSTAAPIDLRIPLRLRMRWEDTTLEGMATDFGNFDLTTHPTARLEFANPIGKLVANGGVQLINSELRLWPNWWVQWSTKLTLDWSNDHGIELGTDNHLELGVRPLRGVELTLDGDLDMSWAPLDTRGDLKWGGMLNLRLNFDEILSGR